VFCAVGAHLDFVLAAVSPTKPPIFTQIDSIKISSIQLPGGSWQIRFELQGDDFSSEFAELCSDLANSIGTINADKTPIQKFHGTYEDWLLFYSRAKTFSLEAARGLYAELVYLESHAASRFGWRQALDSWHGPLKGAHDFVFPGALAVEVKSIQPSGNAVQISSENQLDFAGELHLRVYRIMDKLNPDGVSESLLQKVNQIFTKLDSTTSGIFADLLKNVGFKPDSVVVSERLFEVLEVRCYKIDDAFPKISGNSLHPAINSVNYKLDLASLDSWLLEGE